MNWSTLTPAEKQITVRQAIQIDGLTYAQAAAQLGTTRTAIAGAVERSKRSTSPIVSNSGQGNNAVKRRRVAKKQTLKKPHAGFHKFVAPPGLPAPAEAVAVRSDAWDALPGSSPVAIEDHHEGFCRWPCGQDRPFTYCNEAVKVDSPYCPGHSALAFREPPAAAKRKETA